jgi:hypothetical protein
MLWDAQSVLEQVPGWFEDYNIRAPHLALGDALAALASREMPAVAGTVW